MPQHPYLLYTLLTLAALTVIALPSLIVLVELEVRRELEAVKLK